MLHLNPERTPCPECGQPLEDGTGLTNGTVTAKPGDLTLCPYCGAFLKLDLHLLPSLVSDYDFNHLPVLAQDNLLFAQRQIRSHLTYGGD